MIPERQEEIYILKQELAFLKGKSGIADPNDAEDSIRELSNNGGRCHRETS